MLRPYFLYHRRLPGRPCRPAYETARAMIPATLRDGEQLLPAMFAFVQTFGDDLNWHPHVHALVTRGGWNRSGVWTPVPSVDDEAAALLFRQKVFGFLKREGLRSAERARLLLSWRHSGFSVHTSVTAPPDDGAGLERLARYLLRPPVSLERLHVDEQVPTVAYARQAGHGAGLASSSAPLHPDEFHARVLMHIPEPRLYLVRYYGAYSSVVRAHTRERLRAAAMVQTAQGAVAPMPESLAPLDTRALRHRWAELIRRIYVADPLVCPRCSGPMRIVACITQPKVIATILAHLAANGADGRSPPDAPHAQRPAA